VWLVDVLFPLRCAGCGAAAALLCADCVCSLRVLRPPWCDRCGAPTAWPVDRCRECSGRRIAFAHARAAIAYDGSGRSLVHAWKERGLRTAAALAADLVSAHVERPPVKALVPVATHGERLLRRGHHPAAALARELSVRWDIPVADVLVRTGAPRRQVGLHRDERRRNVRGAFAASAATPAAVALVDDVYTTGATANACAAALRRAGTGTIEVIALARAVR
jgi:ComF family protein